MKTVTSALVVFLVFFCIFSGTLRAQSAANSRPREQFKNAIAHYDWVTNPKSQRIRTIVTRPKNAKAEFP